MEQVEWRTAVNPSSNGRTPANQIRSIHRSAAQNKVAEPFSGDDVGSLVAQLQNLKADLRAEKQAYVDHIVSARSSSSHNNHGRASGSRPDQSFRRSPRVAEGTRVEQALLNHIEQKQAALEASKAELQRSLKLTQEAEQKFNAERAALQRDQASSAADARPAYWSPFTPDIPPVVPSPSIRSDPYAFANSAGVKGHVDETYGHSMLGRGDGTPEHGRWKRAGKNMSLSPSPLSQGTTTNVNLRSNHQDSSSSHATRRVAGTATRDRRKPVGRHHRTNSQPVLSPTHARNGADTPLTTSQLLQALPSSRKEILDLFRNSDVHCTGAVSTDEFARGLLTSGVKLSIPQVRQIVKALDRDNRGEVRYINLLATLDGQDARQFNPFAAEPTTDSKAVDPDGVPLALHAPPPLPHHPSTYVPVPPFDVQSPDVSRALKTRAKQSSALAILRTEDRAIRQPDGTFVPVGHPPQLPSNFASLAGEGATSSPDYWPRAIGFKERANNYTLGPTYLVNSVTANPAEFKPSNSCNWDSSRGPERNEEFGKDYSRDVLAPESTAGSALRSIAERVQLNPRRFKAMMSSLDLDRDRRVTHAEFLKGLGKLGLDSLPAWKTQELIQACDRHATGAIDYEAVAGLLAGYAARGKEEQDSQRVAEEAPHSQVNPYTTIGFTPSLQIPLHSQPVWIPHAGQGNNVDQWKQARHVEQEWRRREEQQQQQQQQAATDQEERKDHKEQAQPHRGEPAQQLQEHEQRHGSPRHRREDSQHQHQQHQRESYQSGDSSAPAHSADSEARDEPRRGGEWVERDANPASPHVHADSNGASSLASTQLAETKTQQPLRAPVPLLARYPYQNATTEERERIAQLERAQQAVQRSPQHTEQHQQQQRQHQSPPHSQEGRALPVLEVEYPSSARSRTPVPSSARRPRSRSSSISSVRSVRSQTPSVAGSGRSGAWGRGGGDRFDPAASFRSTGGGSRASSRRGSFSQASGRSGADGTAGSSTAAQRMLQSSSSSYWSADHSDDTRSERGGRSRVRDVSGTPAQRSSSVSAGRTDAQREGPTHGDAFSQDAEFFKIMRLAQPPPLSAKARAALGTSPQPEVAHFHARAHSQQADASPNDFVVQHAAPAPAAAATAGRTSASSASLSHTAPLRRDSRSTLAFEPRYTPTHTYSQSFGSWTDRRARDFSGSQWSLG